MKIERHETGPRMSKAVIHGDTVYLAGIVADNSKGKSTAEQTKSILSQIDSFLATAGTNKTNLLSAKAMMVVARIVGVVVMIAVVKTRSNKSSGTLLAGQRLLVNRGSISIGKAPSLIG